MASSASGLGVGIMEECERAQREEREGKKSARERTYSGVVLSDAQFFVLLGGTPDLPALDFLVVQNGTPCAPGVCSVQNAHSGTLLQNVQHSGR